jgi:hypothetical protein
VSDHRFLAVMAGPVPAIHVFPLGAAAQTWTLPLSLRWYPKDTRNYTKEKSDDRLLGIHRKSNNSSVI